MKKLLLITLFGLLGIIGHFAWYPDTVTNAIEFMSGQVFQVFYPIPPSPVIVSAPSRIQKLVRNITQNSAEADSVSANPNDTVEFSLRVSSVGSADAQNVIVRDALPAGLTYQAGTTTIDSVTAADGIISTGLNLGTLSSGRTVIIRFRAVVAAEGFFTIGGTRLTSVAAFDATAYDQELVSAHVVVWRGAPPAAIGMGASDSTILIVIIAGIATLIYVGYTSGRAFRIRR